MTERLSQDYIPTHYDLFLHIKENKKACKASVTITFKKNANSDSAYLNLGKNITIDSITQNNTPLKYIVEYPNLVISCQENSNIDLSTYPVTINYIVKPNLHKKTGFFNINHCYFTDFEPNLAKKLLPCFDDPIVRSTFSVKLRIPQNLTGLSNMPIQNVLEMGNEKEITFMKTPPICCYLLCICVGLFDFISGKTKNNLPVKYYAKEGNSQYFGELLNVAIFAIEWMESKMGVNFELPHLQLISHSCISCGMENYGLITLPNYKEHTKSKSCQLVVAHEIVHQWFGDLVSIKWWDSLWLNEGFAEFYQYLILYDMTHSEKIWVKLNDDELCDALSHFRSGVIVPPPDQIDFEDMFDALTYDKGCTVVKMFCDLVGKENFFIVCSKWLSEYKNKSVDLSDFVSLVNSTLNKDYSSFFNCWLKFVGFPALAVKEVVVNDKFVGIEINQVTYNGCCYEFKLPIKYEINGEIKKLDILIDGNFKKVDVEFDWIVVNDNNQSLCFVVYSKVLFKKLVDVRKSGKLMENDIYLIGKSIRKGSIPELIDDEIVELAGEYFKNDF